MSAPPYVPPPAEPLVPLHVDTALVVLIKPTGLLSVPGRGADKADCLATRVQTVIPDALIVHRLDMDTSGLIVMARGTEAHRKLSQAFLARRITKQYTALVAGHLTPDTGTVDLPMRCDWPNRPRQIVDPELGKPATTHWQLLGYDAATESSRVRLEPVTGRSHQLRVHMQALGHPILGDALYASATDRDRAPRLMLHASLLAFLHPFEERHLEFRSDAPF